MNHSPNELIAQYLHAFALAHPGLQVPVISHDGDSFSFKERGEHPVRLGAKDLMQKHNDLMNLVNTREFDLTTLAGLAAASDLASRAATAYLHDHIAPRLKAATTIDEVKAIKLEICMGCVGPNGSMLPLPPEFDLHFMMKFSDLMHFAREAAKAI
jgi:hypothetical protein